MSWTYPVISSPVPTRTGIVKIKNVAVRWKPWFHENFREVNAQTFDYGVTLEIDAPLSRENHEIIAKFDILMRKRAINELSKNEVEVRKAGELLLIAHCIAGIELGRARSHLLKRIIRGPEKAADYVYYRTEILGIIKQIIIKSLTEEQIKRMALPIIPAWQPKSVIFTLKQIIKEISGGGAENG